MGLQEMGKVPHSIHRARKTSKGRENEKSKKEILVFEHKLFMVHPAPYMGLSTKDLST